MSTCLKGWRAQAGTMAAPQIPRPGKWFAWAAVLAGLLPSLCAAGVSLYLLAVALPLSIYAELGGLRTIGALCAVLAFLSGTLFGYWRVVWLYVAGRRLSATLWFGSVLLILVWLAVYVWKLANIRYADADILVVMGLSLPSFALWIYALKRTY
ncbi:hypothetical protein EMGBS10_09840 [Opitutia bacterium]|nr:hypothetical protein EMGBS10_09840 [Opitutae bacterium]